MTARHVLGPHSFVYDMRGKRRVRDDTVRADLRRLRASLVAPLARETAPRRSTPEAQPQRRSRRVTYAEGWSYSDREWEMNLRRAGTKPKPWKAPRLLSSGRPFTPTGHEVGAWITVRFDGAWCVLAQVWSPSPRGVWAVLADEQRAVEVCVRNKHIPSCRDLAHIEGGAS